MENRNLGDSGRKRRITAVKIFGKALATTNVLHELNVIDSPGSSTAQS
jgi:hypothetical protein